MNSRATLPTLATTARFACWIVAAASVAEAPADAATVLRQSILIEIEAQGTFSERHQLEVRIDRRGDLEQWKTFAIYLDEHRRLTEFAAFRASPTGRREKVKRRQQDRVEYSAGATLYGSAYYHVVDFERLAEGTVLEIDYTVEESPYFPARTLPLTGKETIAELAIEIRGSDLRWRIDGPGDGYEVEETPGRLLVTGSDIEEVETTPLAAGGSAVRPVLRYAWGGQDSWAAVASWYRDLLRDLPAGAPAVAALATELTAGATSPRQRLEELLSYLRRKVRYVAVEVGIGGYRPSPVAEVLERRWGDCKDKSLLLIELLGAVGVTAHPALILADEERRIDVLFPSLDQFNHLIVAVPTSAVEIVDGDPVAGGYLFLDPTQTRGSARWLHPAVQDQDALVVTAAGGELVRTPLRPAAESTVLALAMELSSDGNGVGRAGVRFTGRTAASIAEELRTAPPDRAQEVGLGMFQRLLPWAELSGLGWEEVEGPVPAVRFSLAVAVSNLIDFSASRPSLRLPALASTPEPSRIDEVDSALVYPSQETITLWKLILPADAGCRFELGDRQVENPVGVFTHSVRSTADRTFEIERTTRLERRWIEPQDLPHFRELALAEHRASRRRLRLDCDRALPDG